MPSVPVLTTPPGTVTPYVLPCFTGELWTIPTSNSTMRLLVTGKETNSAFAVVGTGGTFDKPIGFHYHKEAHDVFLCLKGTINVWANDQARTLYPGDFASVPPGTVHQYQISSSHTEFLGLIIPGGWEEFFRFIGEPFSGPLFPTNDKRNPFQVLIPKLIAATEKFDMIPMREKPHYDPQPWDGSESKLPGSCSDGGYFLKADSGPKFLAAGLLVRPMATRKETKDRFAIYAVEGSALNAKQAFAKQLRFKDTHHALQAVEGVLELEVEGERVRATVGETVFVPAGAAWRFGVESVFAKAYLFANGGGMGEVLVRTGKAYEFAVVHGEEEAVGLEEKALEGLRGELGFEIV